MRDIPYLGQIEDFEPLVDDVLFATYLYRSLLARLEWVNLADVFWSMLEKAGHDKSVGHFWWFLTEKGYEIEKSSLYRYFSRGESVRLPRDERFIELFSEYLGTSERDYVFLMMVWRLKVCGRLGLSGNR